MSGRPKLVVLGLSLSSSWGNGHATTYRALLRAMAKRGYDILFLERDVPWYAAERDLPSPAYCRLAFYPDLDALAAWREEIALADAVIVGSYVPDGIAIGRWIQQVARGRRAFYDIDTPVTLAAMRRGECTYLTPELVAGYDLYLSFTGGPLLRDIERRLGAPMARALYCSVDADRYRPARVASEFALSYLGTYSRDRQGALEELLLEPARRAPHLRFAVAGSLYPAGIRWPANVRRIEHVSPGDHPSFYGRSRFTLNVTRADMRKAGFSPSVRVFEAAACGSPILSDDWPGLDTLLVPGRDIAIVRTAGDVLEALETWPEARRTAMAAAARRRILAEHTAARRAEELEAYLREARPASTARPGGKRRSAVTAGSLTLS